MIRQVISPLGLLLVILAIHPLLEAQVESVSKNGTKQAQSKGERDISAFVNEIVKESVKAHSIALLKKAMIQAKSRLLMDLFKVSGKDASAIADPEAEQGPEPSPTAETILPTLDPDDVDADPQKYISPIALKATCEGSHQQVEQKSYWDIFGLFRTKPIVGPKTICVPLSACASKARLNDQVQFCERSFPSQESGRSAMGVCCPEEALLFETETSNLPYLSTLSGRTMKPVNLQRHSSVLADANLQAMKLIKKMYWKQEKYRDEGIFCPMITILDTVHPDSRDFGDGGLGLVEVTRAMARKLTGSSTLVKQVPPASVLNTQISRAFCPLSTETEFCGETELKYRTLDGSCNNMKDPNMGQGMEPLIRITQSAYEDGIFSPRHFSKIRISKDKYTLPSPRKVIAALSLLSDVDPDLSEQFTFGFAEHGGFIANDMSNVDEYDLGTDFKIKCCTADGKHLAKSDDVHPLCNNIDVAEDDPVYGPFGVTCMPLVRSMVSSKRCSLGAAQQVNQATHWLDLSQVYGVSDKTSKFLRTFKNGQLINFEYNGNDYLMLDSSCNLATLEGKCAFRTGDNRANREAYLTMIHTLWRREHNRVANILNTLNPHWNDELLFQESRKLVIAEYQHITYNEFVPFVIGTKYAEKFGLVPQFEGFTSYDEEVDGSVSNEHTTAAFRMGHSTIPNSLKIISKDRATAKYPLSTGIYTPLKIIGDDIPDSIIRGFTRMAMKNVDQYANSLVTGKLFAPSSSLFGHDLFSTNIQRGRDHGLPGYADIVNSLSSYCDLPHVFSFKDFANLMAVEKVQQLQEVYEHYEDVDIYIAGLMEKKVTGGIVGPTFACIIADQFSRSKYGDRFHYEHGGQPNSFTEAQLKQIRQSSAARIYCDNSRDIHEMQPLAFQKPSQVNPLVDCYLFETIPKVDLSFWRNNQTSTQ